MKAIARMVSVGLLLAAAFGGNAWARDGGHGGAWHGGGRHDGGWHGGVGVGVYLGPTWPWYYPGYYPPYYSPYYPPAVAVPAYPPAYVEQGGATAESAPQTGYWYYCRDPAGYYPYVNSCPSGWMTVIPSAPPGSQ